MPITPYSARVKILVNTGMVIKKMAFLIISEKPYTRTSLVNCFLTENFDSSMTIIPF